ncbi:MAG: gp53-like domain-containing protein [Blastocatellia bacterium]
MSVPYLIAPIFSWPAAPGGKLHTYASGGTTPLPTYSDAAGSVPNINPVTLDSTGSAVVRGDGAFHFLLKDPTDSVTIWDADVILSPLTTAADVGAILYPQTAAELAAGVTPVNDAYAPLPIMDVRRHGYLADNSTDNATALSNAVAVAAATAGATIQLPPGIGLFSSFPSLVNKQQIIFQGTGAANAGQTGGTTLIFMGTGAGTIVNMNSAFGCQFKNLQFEHNSSGFTGTYFGIGNDGSHGNATFCAILDCFLGANIGTGVTHINLDKGEDFTCERTLFFSGNPSVKGQAAGGGSYAIRVAFFACQWVNSLGVPVDYLGEAWAFIGCTFEPLSSGLAGAIQSLAATPVKGLSIIGCWFGDVTVLGGTWISVNGQAVDIIGNRFGGFATSTVAVNLAPVTGCSITGNSFDTFSVGIGFGLAGSSGVEVTGNYFTSVTNIFGSTSNAPNNLVFNPNSPLVAPITSVTGKVAANGYETSANGIIRMWGSKTVTIGTPLAIVFATEVGRAFPTALFNVQASLDTPSAATDTVSTSSSSITGTTLSVAGTAGTTTVYWTATGN